MSFTHLHVHSHYSLMDGYNTPEELLKAAKAKGQDALAITDHGTLAAHREMLEHSKKIGIKPILGLEAYISPTDRFDKRSVKKREDNTQLFNHIILLAKSQDGLNNLNRLSEIAWTEGFYHKPRIDLDVLEEYKSGLIVLSGCMNGLIARAIERGSEGDARIITKRLVSAFGEDFYMEVQPHNPVELNRAMLDLADEFGVPAVATADCHYADAKDRGTEEALLILSTKPTRNKNEDYESSRKIKDTIERFDALYPDRPISFAKINVYVSGREEIAEEFVAQGFNRTDILDNTRLVSEKVGQFEFHTGLDLLPKPKGDDPAAILEKKVMAGLRERGVGDKPEYINQAKDELAIVKDKGFSSYFLIVGNMVAWARSKDILVGPGRGSAVGSVICWALGITNVDPLKYGLLFFRFINPERNDYPDIDTDFEDVRRAEVKDYLKRLYKHVASIATFGTFQGKNSIRDASKIYAVPLGDVNRALKNLEGPPDKPEAFFEIFERSDQGREFMKAYPEVLPLAKKLAGRIRSTGMHASGLVLSSEPLNKYVPIETAKDTQNPTGPRVAVVANDMETVADIGLQKLDALGLKALTVVHETQRQVKARHGKDIVLEDIPLDDKAIYADFSNGFTKGCFQVEQPAYTSLLLKMQVTNIDELAASNALVRPGAANTIGSEYLARKQGRAQVKYPHPCMESFTKETFGCIVYQEQVMLTMTELAGMKMTTADKVRKIIGKKKDRKEFEQFKAEFVEGASKKIDKEAAEKLWHDFEAHSDYSFNKSHAVAYSYLSYWTAWLKHYYPLEFMYATLKFEGDKDSRTEYLIEAKRLGIKILLPHVNDSDLDFSIQGNAIRFGLSGIKFISTTLGNKIMSYRPFKTYRQFAEKVIEKDSGLNTRILQAMNAIGAAEFADNPRRGDERDNYYEYLSIPAFDVAAITPLMKEQFRPLDEYDERGTFIIMGMVKKIKRGKGWARIEVVDETGSVGIFHIENTLIETGQMYIILVGDNRIIRYIPISEIEKRANDAFIRFLNKPELNIPDDKYVVIAFQSRTTKAGKKMATIVLANKDKELKKVLVFSPMFHKAFGKAQEGQVVSVKLDTTDDKSLYLKEVL